MQLTEDRFLVILGTIAEERNDRNLAQGIREQRSAFRLFENSHLDSFGMTEFVLRLEEYLRTEEGFKSNFLIPDDQLEYGQSAGDLYVVVCDLAGHVPVRTSALVSV